MSETGQAEEWYWCLEHEQVEPRGECRAEARLGPYPSRAAARAWRETHEARTERWEEQDERWHGETD